MDLQTSTLMAESDAEDNEEVRFIDLQKNLKTLSQKELRALAKVLIDAYYVSSEDGYQLDASVDICAKLRPERVPDEGPSEEPGVRLRTDSTFIKDNAPRNPLKDQVSRTVVVLNEPSEEPGALAKKSKGKLVVEESLKGLIKVQRSGTVEIDRLTMLLDQGEADLALLKAEQTATGISWEPGAMLAL
ncbi:hypothetical protein HAX54_045534 [Datura stramonium]|uniref:Uncharacterized protein n=1 Tax=Datura stramonium TaxID=4076 RepID=A0ABS8SQP8_DATST|nr:hypothetical protein [Datura stramonium]